MGRRERREKKKKRRRTIISLILLFLMVFGFTLASIIVNRPQGTSTAQQPRQGGNTVSYNGYEFEFTGDYYKADIQDKERNFLFTPLDTQGIEMPAQARQSLQNAPVYILTFNPNSSDIQSIELARYQITRNLDKRVVAAVTRNSSQYTLPIITCDNATPSNPVIYLNSENQTNINYKNGCVTINGLEGDLIRATEKVIYEILGVINGN